MKNIKLNQLIEYISPTLILSYFLVHNIFLVLIGITFSLYLINIDIINNIRNLINNKLVVKKQYMDSNKNAKEIELTRMNIKSIRNDNKLTLVEEIEELGFIPSIDKKDNSNAA